MQQQTHDRKSLLRWGQQPKGEVATADPNETDVLYNGVIYKVLRRETFDKIMKSRWPIADVACFSLGVSLVSCMMGYQMAIQKPPVVVEKPIVVEKPTIVEKPVPVNSGCLFFCNR